jgi:hypothetical protein
MCSIHSQLTLPQSLTAVQDWPWDEAGLVPLERAEAKALTLGNPFFQALDFGVVLQLFQKRPEPRSGVITWNGMKLLGFQGQPKLGRVEAEVGSTRVELLLQTGRQAYEFSGWVLHVFE